MQDDNPKHRDKEVLEALWNEHDGNKSSIADELDVAVSTVRRWLDRHEIAPSSTTLATQLSKATADAIGEDPSSPEGSA